ncbi:MAG: nucleotide exchange factor GrpE [Clostridia bacterium]|nr:nucleotide exchange factor GrpE [Clostridia bacterium]
MIEKEPNQTEIDETPAENEEIVDIEEETEPETQEEPQEDVQEGKATKGKKKDKVELAKLRKELAATQEALVGAVAELEETKEKYVRMMAEYDNFRRRTAKERESLFTDATFDVLKDLLPVIDNLERALLMAGDNEQVAKGLQMTLGAVEEMLKKHGVEAYGEVGDTFDPNLHNAVMHDEDPEKPEAYISDVFMRGYKKEDRVLRYAMVKVLN